MFRSNGPPQYQLKLEEKGEHRVSFMNSKLLALALGQENKQMYNPLAPTHSK